MLHGLVQCSVAGGAMTQLPYVGAAAGAIAVDDQYTYCTEPLSGAILRAPTNGQGHRACGATIGRCCRLHCVLSRQQPALECAESPRAIQHPSVWGRVSDPDRTANWRKSVRLHAMAVWGSRWQYAPMQVLPPQNGTPGRPVLASDGTSLFVTDTAAGLILRMNVP